MITKADNGKRGWYVQVDPGCGFPFGACLPCTIDFVLTKIETANIFIDGENTTGEIAPTNQVFTCEIKARELVEDLLYPVIREYAARRDANRSRLYELLAAPVPPSTSLPSTTRD